MPDIQNCTFGTTRFLDSVKTAQLMWLFNSSVEEIIEYVNAVKIHFQNLQKIELHTAWTISIDEIAQILKNLKIIEFGMGWNRIYGCCYKIESNSGYALIISQGAKYLIKYKKLDFHPSRFDYTTQDDYVIFTNQIEYLGFEFEGIAEDCVGYDNFSTDLVTDSVIVLHK